MDYTTALGVWAVAITGPCVVSWLAGDMVGSSRTRQLFADSDTAADAVGSASALRVEQWRVKGAIHPLRDEVGEACVHRSSPPSYAEQAAEAERRHQRRAALAAAAPSPIQRSQDAPVVVVRCPDTAYAPVRLAASAQELYREQAGW